MHVVCLLKTAAKAANVQIDKLPSRALILVVQPFFMNNPGMEEFDINMPHTWTSVQNISALGRTRWKFAALGAITTIRAALMHAGFSDALVVTSSRSREGTSMCKIRIYICSGLMVTDTLEFYTKLEQMSTTLCDVVPKTATTRGVSRVVFITDMDYLTSKIEWGDAEMDARMSDVISDLSPSHVEAFSSSEACRSAALAVALARPSDMVNVAMQMSCSDAYNDIWVTKLKAFVEFRKLNVKPDKAYSYHY
jgi:hypothetical protein